MKGVRLEAPSMGRVQEFLAAVARSQSFQRPWIKAPSTRPAFRRYVQRSRTDAYLGFFVVARDDDALIGVVNVNEIVRGALCSGYLGYYAFLPFAGRGLMRAGLELVLARCFREHRLHRVEANIQPGNEPSRRLVGGLGFSCEGVSPRYLKVGGRWRDHERWALLADDWRARRRERP